MEEIQPSTNQCEGSRDEWLETNSKQKDKENFNACQQSVCSESSRNTMKCYFVATSLSLTNTSSYTISPQPALPISSFPSHHLSPILCHNHGHNIPPSNYQHINMNNPPDPQSHTWTAEALTTLLTTPTKRLLCTCIDNFTIHIPESLLCYFSRYYAALLHGSFVEAGSNAITLELNAEQAKTFVTWMYSGRFAESLQ
jgi:hypothetical protein